MGEDAIYEVDEVVAELLLTGTPLIIADKITAKIAADLICEELYGEIHILKSLTDASLAEINDLINEKKLSYVVGVGGGKILDAGKVSSFKAKIPFISVPTAASHDGIASPQASLKRDTPTSVQVHCPLGVIADTKIISNAPKNLLSAGCADAISNYTAVLDWKLAHKEKKEYFGDYASALSSMTADIIMNESSDVYDNISILVEALISSGVAIGIAGSSRPCSGAEHLFSHTLDMIAEKPALHGHQCGVGTIIMAYLHGADWMKVKESLETLEAPTTAKSLGIDDNTVVDALTKAHDVRDRYTILRGGISKAQALDVAKATGVIE